MAEGWELPDLTLATRAHSAIIRACYAAGVSQADLARQGGARYRSAPAVCLESESIPL